MGQYVMVIDLDKCLGCHSCSVACRAKWQVPEEFARSWVTRLGPENTPYGISHTFYPGQCNQCDKPFCVNVCPVKKVVTKLIDPVSGKNVFLSVSATWKDPFNGTISIDKERCIGCGACVGACPYGARYVNKSRVGEGKADKCDFCMELVQINNEPICVQTCLVGGRIFGDKNDPDSEVSKYIKKGAVSLKLDSIDIGPNVYYYGSQKDIFLLNQCVVRKNSQTTPEYPPKS